MNVRDVKGWPHLNPEKYYDHQMNHIKDVRNRAIENCESALAPYEIIPKDKLTEAALIEFSRWYDMYFMGKQHKLEFFRALRGQIGLEEEKG